VAYDEELADRVRELVGAEAGLSELRMFGAPAGAPGRASPARTGR
jgi:hypothetical protein